MVERGGASWWDVDIIAIVVVVARGDVHVVWDILGLDMGNIDFGGCVGEGVHGVVERGG